MATSNLIAGEVGPSGRLRRPPGPTPPAAFIQFPPRARTLTTHPDRFFIIHYSSQSLFDEGADGLSPRITSVVAMHFATRQTASFTIHAVAEILGITKDEVVANYDQIEKELLRRAFVFIRDSRDKIWIHWNMRNLTYGFEHLEHRYTLLGNGEPAVVPVENRINLDSVLREKYGPDYAPNPRMKSLMELNGPPLVQFLTGSEEAAAFKAREFIRMNSSTMTKVEFFRGVVVLAQAGRLRTASRGWGVRIDRLIEGRAAKAALLLLGLIGGVVAVWQIFLWLHGG